MLLKMRLRTGSSTLAQPLFARHVPMATSPTCPICAHTTNPTDETVEHFLLRCHMYEDDRVDLQSTLDSLLPSNTPAFLDDPAATVSRLLDDRFWVQHRVFNEANQAICSYLEQIWTVRQELIEINAINDAQLD
jgi:hypothetical protein